MQEYYITQQIAIDINDAEEVNKIFSELSLLYQLLHQLQDAYSNSLNNLNLNERDIFLILTEYPKVRHKKKLLRTAYLIQQNIELHTLIEKLKALVLNIDNNELVYSTIQRYVHTKNKNLQQPVSMPPKIKFSKKLIELDDNNILRIKIRTTRDRQLKVKLPDNLKYITKITSAKAIYESSKWWLQVTCKYKENKGHTAGIDLGQRNLISLVSTNPSLRSIIISNEPLSSLYNILKRIEKLQNDSVYVPVKFNITTNNILKQCKWLIMLCFDRMTTTLAEILSETKHNTVYIGKINLPANISSFLKFSIKELELTTHMKEKLKEKGIELVEVDESFTSQASSLSDDIIKIQQAPKHIKIEYSGRRINRCIYRDNILQIELDADLNGAMNILKVGTQAPKLPMDKNIAVAKLTNPVTFDISEFLLDKSKILKKLALK